MKSLIRLLDKEISLILDDEAIESLIDKLNLLKKNNQDIYFEAEDGFNNINIQLIKFSLLDKRIIEFYHDIETSEFIKTLKKK